MGGRRLRPFTEDIVGSPNSSGNVGDGAADFACGHAGHCFLREQLASAMHPSMSDFMFTLRLLRHEPGSLYDRLGERYDRFHRRWLNRAGADSLAALQGCLAAELRPGIRILDAGCGPGALARWVVEQEQRVQMTLVDAAPSMLKRAAYVPGRHVRASLLSLPFGAAEFDVVICAWALETTEDPCRAAAELERVLAPGGLLCCCVCTEPGAWSTRLSSLPLRLAVVRLFKGAFLPGGFPAAPALESLRRLDSSSGLATFICWRKPAGG